MRTRNEQCNLARATAYATRFFALFRG
jgi:hypothetical protein